MRKTLPLLRRAGALCLILLLGGCGHNVLIADGKGGRYKVGGVYKVKGVKYHARENLNYVETGLASWYGKAFHGKRTANGEIYNMHQLTAAHKTLPMPTYARITNLANGRSLVLRINDRGPYKSDHGTDTRNRIIDVSRKAAQMLGFLNKGIARVEVRYIGRARPSDEGQLARNLKYRRIRGQFRVIGESGTKRHYHIKVGLYKSRQQASHHRRLVHATKLAPTHLQKEGKGWRLIIGPFEAKNEAQAAQAILAARGYDKLLILASKSR